MDGTDYVSVKMSLSRRAGFFAGLSAAVVVLLALILILASLPPPAVQYSTRTRMESIPVDAVKMAPLTDEYPPVLHSSLWNDPVPLSGPVNTAGAEDSPFILPDGNTIYFFFTPDVRKTPQQQLLDDVTGIWESEWNGTAWSEPKRIWIQDPGKLALDGAEFVQGDSMWFASAREGFTGVNLFTAALKNGKWSDWKYVGDKLNKDYQVGEMHITADGMEMYFHSSRAGGKGQLDIWVTKNVNGEWLTPSNVMAVNSAENEGWPFVSQDGKELWFTRSYLGSPGIFRSINTNGSWSSPELIVSSFAGEPTLDQQGNLYFVHHYYKDGVMIEADIYVAYRK